MVATLPAIVGHTSGLEILRLAVALLSIPLMSYLIWQHGRNLIAVLFLGILLLHAQWGITQFIVQKDLGLYLIGESVISPTQNAVAKFSFSSGKLLRAYGPHAHANALAGMMVIGLTLLFNLQRRGALPQAPRFLLVSSCVFLLATLVTFSRTAYAGVFLLALLAGVIYRVRLPKVPLVSFILIISFLPLLSARFTDLEDQALADRGQGYAWWSSIVQGDFPWLGMGVGEYPQVLQRYLERTSTPYYPWEIAPVHSVPLLLWAEWGGIAVIAIVLLLMTVTVKKWRGGRAILSMVWMVPLLPALIFDHYFLTQPAALLGIILLGLLLPEKEFPQFG
jgi:hypothetical protein